MPSAPAIITTNTGRRVIAFGDVAHIATQLAHPHRTSAPDNDREQVLASRTWLLDELSQPGTVGFAGHFGDQAFGTIRRGDGWQPVPTRTLD